MTVGKVVHIFLKDISPKIIIMAQIELKFAYFDATFQHIIR